MTIPGIGPVGATALAASDHQSASVPLGAAVRCLVGTDTTAEVERSQRTARSYHQDGRQVPAQAAHVGMTSLVRRPEYNPATIDPRLADLLARKPTRVATVAMANKTARVIWGIMSRGETYRTGHRPALAA